MTREIALKGRLWLHGRVAARAGAVAVVALLGALAGLGTAGATHRTDTILEQHWEQLGETRTVTRATSVPVWRGTLPGGTAKLDPQPTATLEVLAKVTGASEISGAPVWAAHLRSNTGTILATTQFYARDTSLTLAVGDLEWPSVDRRIGDVLLEPIAAVPGTLEVKKAYVKIRQEGTIKATSGRFHLAQAATVSSLDWSDVADPILYRHVSGDFDPAPAVRLRVSGSAALGGADVRLVDQAGAVVAGSELSFSGGVTMSTAVASGVNKETGSLALQTGSTYRLQAKGSGGFKLFGADLIFEQATSDEHGLTSTVGWYTGVPVATDIISDQEDLGFSFRLPQVVTPYRTDSWTGTLRRTAGTGSVGVALTDTTGEELARISTTSDSYVHTSSSASASTALTRSDSATRLSTEDPLNPTAGRVAQTALRVHAQLKDQVAPVIAAYNATNRAFSPNADGSKDTTTLSANLVDVSPPVAWTVTVTDGSGAIVRTASGSTNASMSWTWDGKNSSGTTVADGSYTATLTATDAVGNSSNAPLTLTVDTVAPTVAALAAAPDPFSPNADGYLDATVFSTTLSESLPWSLAIKNSSGITVKTFTGTGSSVAQAWDGLLVADGLYTGVLTASDAAGNSASTSETVTRDATGPTISSYAATPTPFSPNGDGVKDTLSVTANLSDAWTPIDWTVDIKNAALTVVRSYSGQGTTVSATWDGTDSAGAEAPEGIYTVTLTAKDAGRNVSTRLSAVELDVTPPGLSSLSLSPNPFSPESVAPRDRVAVEVDLSESRPWTIDIRDGDGVTKRSYSGAGESAAIQWDGRDAAGNRVPDAAYEVIVTSADGGGNTLTESSWITVGDGPVVASVSPAAAQRGQDITITGTGFGEGLGTFGVTIDGDDADIVSWTDTSIVAQVPPGTAPGIYDLDVWAADLTADPVTIQVVNYLLPDIGQQVEPGTIVFKVKPGVQASNVTARQGDGSPTPAFGAEETDPDLARWFEVAVAPGLESAKVLSYAADFDVQWAEPKYPAPEPDASPDDDRFRSGQQWGLDQANDVDIDAPEAWDVSKGSAGITIAVIDSGIGPHPDLTANLASGGRDYTSGGSASEGCDGASHGTHVAGIASAVTNNSVGVAGVGWNTKVRSYRVHKTSNGDCRWSANVDLSRVIRDAANDDNQVINMSLGAPGRCYGLLQDAITYAHRKNRVVVASAGNDNTSKLAYPASCDHVLAVGALGKGGGKAYYSNYGSWVDVFAPGGNQDFEDDPKGIMSTWRTASGSTTYKYIQGTSMATPFVAGTAALVRSKTARPAAIVSAIKSTTEGTLRRVSAARALGNIPPVSLADGMFVKARGGAAVWFIDGGVRRKVTSKVLVSWGLHGSSSQVAIVEREQIAEFSKDDQLGFRPGTVISISTDRKKVDPTRLYAVTNDGSGASRWTRGTKRLMLPSSFACLGYEERDVEIIGERFPHEINPTDADNPVTSCDRHPNGAILEHSTRGFFVLQGGAARRAPHKNILLSWGMMNERIGPTPVIDFELDTLLGSGAAFGFRPGRLIRNSDKKIFLITTAGTDFPRSQRRYFDNSEARSLGAVGCYGYKVKLGRDNIALSDANRLSLHDPGATLLC